MTITATISSDTTDRRRWSETYPIGNGRSRTYQVRRGSPDHPLSSTRVYVDFAGGFDLLENLVNRTSRPYATVKPAVKATLEAAGYDTRGMRWSQKAGCSMCPCSPGFILPRSKGHDIWVDLSEPAPVKAGSERERLARLAQAQNDPSLPFANVGVN